MRSDRTQSSSSGEEKSARTKSSLRATSLPTTYLRGRKRDAGAGTKKRRRRPRREKASQTPRSNAALERRAQRAVAPWALNPFYCHRRRFCFA